MVWLDNPQDSGLGEEFVSILDYFVTLNVLQISINKDWELLMPFLEDVDTMEI